MAKFIVRRFFSSLIILIGISILVFLLIRMIPGDVLDIQMGTNITALTDEQIQALRAYYGIDQPVYIQYFRWISSVLHGDFGICIRTGRPVLTEIMAKFPVTLELTILGSFFGALFGITLGIISALHRGTALDSVARGFGIVGLSVPVFWCASLVVLLCSVRYKWLPQTGAMINPFIDPIGNLRQMLLPALCLGLALSATVMRMTRSSMLEVLQQEYVRTANSKGLKKRRVTMVHAFRNALIPVITVLGIQIGQLLGGTVVIEQIFAIPGIGSLTVNAISQRDYAMVQGSILFIAVNYLVINFLVDVLYAVINPQIRY